MLLRCVKKFGNFKPGDEVEAPDGAEFDRTYFEPAVKKQARAKEEGK